MNAPPGKLAGTGTTVRRKLSIMLAPSLAEKRPNQPIVQLQRCVRQRCHGVDLLNMRWAESP
jgi:hypothetical protein